MNEQILGTQISYFIVGVKGEETFPVNIYGFTASRANDIQRAKWFDDEDTVSQMTALLNTFAQLNGDTTVFTGRKQLVEYTEVV